MHITLQGITHII